ncbi:unnamed protein product [Prunus brigantina]
MYAKCGDLAGTRKVFDRMLIRNEISWLAILAGYGMHGVFGEVFELFDRMVEAGERPDVVTFTMVLTACSHGGLTDKRREQGGTGGGGRGVGFGDDSETR